MTCPSKQKVDRMMTKYNVQVITFTYEVHSGRHVPPSWQGELSHGFWGTKNNYINAKVGSHKLRIYNDFN